MEFFDAFIEKGVIERLQTRRRSPFAHLPIQMPSDFRKIGSALLNFLSNGA